MADQQGHLVLDLLRNDQLQRPEIENLKARVRRLETQETLFLRRDIVDAKGDLLVGSANDVVDNLTVGANNTVLVADSAQTLGVKWAVISNTILDDMPQATVKGRAVGAGTGDPTDLTATQLNAIVGTADLFVPSNTITVGASSDEGRGQMGVPYLKVKGQALLAYRESADSQGINIEFLKRRSGTATILSNGDQLGSIAWTGADSTTFGATGARIVAEVDGTPGSGDMPTRILFMTSPDASATPAESFRVNASQNLIVADGKRIETDEVRARDSSGLILKDDGGNYGIFIEDGGQVGIGTATPAATLDINGVLQQYSTNGYIRTVNASQGGAYLQNVLDANTSFSRIVLSHNAYWDTDDDLWHVQAIGANDATAILVPNGGGLKIIQHSDTGNVARTFSHANFIAGAKLTMDTSGKVGIGNTAPTALLHVGAGTDSSGVGGSNCLLVSNAGTSWLSVRNATDNIEALIYVDTTIGVIGTLTNHPLSIRTNNTTSLYVDTSQQVGIGTTAPDTKLHVSGAAEAIRITGSGTTGNASIGYLTIYDSNNTTRRGFIGDASTGNVDLYVQADTGALRLRADAADCMYLTNGTVGIGTTAPQTYVHVYGSTGGCAFFNKTGIVGSAQTLIADGTGDVVRGVRITGVIYRATGGFMGGVSQTINNNANYDFTIDAGTNTLRFAVSAAGALTVIRQAGTDTWSIAIWAVWM